MHIHEANTNGEKIVVKDVNQCQFLSCQRVCDILHPKGLNFVESWWSTHFPPQSLWRCWKIWSENWEILQTIYLSHPKKKPNQKKLCLPQCTIYNLCSTINKITAWIILLAQIPMFMTSLCLWNFNVLFFLSCQARSGGLFGSHFSSLIYFTVYF